MSRTESGFHIPERELCSRYERLFTAAVNDVLRELGHLYCTLPYTIMPLRDEMKVCGIAFTISGEKSSDIEGEMERRAEMLDAIHPESVVVWETNNDDSSAQWGEIMTLAARKKGCRGAVIDGGIRDTDRILTQNFPVFCRYRSSSGMLGRFRMTGYQRKVTIGNVEIAPGDVVFADIDGVIIIPRELAYEVLIRAEKIGSNEEKIKEQVSGGVAPSEVVRGGGYF